MRTRYVVQLRWPTRETIEWLAAKLGVDAGFLERGVSADERSRVEAMLARAEALANAHQYEEAIEELENARTAVLALLPKALALAR